MNILRVKGVSFLLKIYAYVYMSLCVCVFANYADLYFKHLYIKDNKSKYMEKSKCWRILTKGNTCHDK